ncbi:MAG: hypothetical protein Q7T74_01070 [Candidatus Saccharibacteria bacterium]|nr:hypothetical protein [Candidatus Saccharibacteria bacterium]
MSNVQQETQEEIELRMKIIQEALAEMQAKGVENQSTTSMDMQALVDPMDDLACEGCQ